MGAGLFLLFLLLLPAPAQAADRIVVGSKNFEESRLLAEMFAQLPEARTDLEVERRLGLAGTQVCFEALRTGAIDLYPEYTGTGLVSILGAEATGNAATTLRRVRTEFLSRWDLWWLAPLGFENSWEIAVPQELAEREGLRTISDLARISGTLRGGFGPRSLFPVRIRDLVVRGRNHAAGYAPRIPSSGNRSRPARTR